MDELASFPKACLIYPDMWGDFVGLLPPQTKWNSGDAVSTYNPWATAPNINRNFAVPQDMPSVVLRVRGTDVIAYRRVGKPELGGTSWARVSKLVGDGKYELLGLDGTRTPLTGPEPVRVEPLDF